MLAKKIAIGLGIAVILPLMIHFGVKIIVEYPERSDYMVENYRDQLRDEKLSDEAKDQIKAEQIALDDAFDETKKRFYFILFSIAVPLGVLAILLGTFLKLKGLSTGLIFGGLFSTINGFMHQWGQMNEAFIFICLLIIFSVLIFVSIKKIDR